MKAARITLRDVAEATGVHFSTVSRAMNPATRHLLKDEVAERILEAARRLGYRTNVIASSLRTRRSKAVGVLIPDICNPVFPPILIGIEDALREAGYSLVVANTGNDEARQATLLEEMIARQVDGLILATARRQDALIADLSARGFPLVMVNRQSDDVPVAVVNDEGRGIALALDHLVGLGHVAIGHVAGPQQYSTGAARRAAFLAGLAARGLAHDEARIVIAAAFAREAGRVASAALLRRGLGLTAIVAGNDLLALGCLDALRAAGLACPGDCSLTGYNDMPLVDMLDPPLTTVRIRHHEMGAAAARLLLQQLAGGPRPDRAVVLPPELVIRRSTAPRPTAG
jgi:LacI family transcriptional regulator